MHSRNSFGTHVLITKSLLLTLTLVLLQNSCLAIEFLHSFTPLPQYPRGKLAQGPDGSFYGTSSGGGSSTFGTVFKVASNGVFTPVASLQFGVHTGMQPLAGLILASDGQFYGTASSGGTNAYGTVFRCTTDGNLAAIFSFSSTNGNKPQAAVVEGTDGKLYGTTFSGGAGNYGTIFRISKSGQFESLFSFSGTNGANPTSDLLQGADGAFYGTTSHGGPGTNNLGTVFRITTNGTHTVLAWFDGTNGGDPEGGLVQGADSAFYGTTRGGALSMLVGNPNVYGTVFKITTNGILTTLAQLGDPIGAFPMAGLTVGDDGNFYGTTSANAAGRCGGIFRITPTGTITSLGAFAPGTVGTSPQGDCESQLLNVGNGLFYGTTQGGSIFRVGSNGSLTTLVSVAATNSFAFEGGLIQAHDGNFYGTTSGQGDWLLGLVYKMTPGGSLQRWRRSLERMAPTRNLNLSKSAMENFTERRLLADQKMTEPFSRSRRMAI